MSSPFQQALLQVLELPAYGSQKKLASAACVDPGQLNRLIKGSFKATPDIVGRMVGTLPKAVGVILLHAYLQEVAARVGSVKRPAKHEGAWRSPGVFKVQIQIE